MGYLVLHGLPGVAWGPWCCLGSLVLLGVPGVAWGPWYCMGYLVLHGLPSVAWVTWCFLGYLVLLGLPGVAEEVLLWDIAKRKPKKHLKILVLNDLQEVLRLLSELLLRFWCFTVEYFPL